MNDKKYIPSKLEKTFMISLGLYMSITLIALTIKIIIALTQ